MGGGDDVGRAACTAEWMANAAGLTGRLPSTTSPVWLTRIRSETRTWRKLMPKGFTQKWSVSSGSRAVMWPATPSEKPKRPNSRSAPASFCLRCRRSSSTLANFGRDRRPERASVPRLAGVGKGLCHGSKLSSGP